MLFFAAVLTFALAAAANAPTLGAGPLSWIYRLYNFVAHQASQVWEMVERSLPRVSDILSALSLVVVDFIAFVTLF